MMMERHKQREAFYAKASAGREDSMINQRLFFTVFLILGFLALFYFLFNLFAPFLTAMAWAAMIVLVFKPLHRRVLKETGGRESLAAFLMCLFLSLFVLLPTVIVGMLLIQELLQNANVLSATARELNFNQLLEWPPVAHSLNFVAHYIDLNTLNLKDQLIKLADQTSNFLLSQSAGFVFVLSNFLLTVALIELNMFFFFRDGHHYLAYIQSLLPLTLDAKQTLNRRVSEVVQTAVLGTFATAAADGLLGGIIFALLGLASPVLWGVLMGILALIPLVGAVVIWAPAALYLVFHHQPMQAGILVAWGLIVMMGLADNLIRPLLMRRICSDDTRMNPLVLFLSVIGGIQLYGLLGIVIGPLIVIVAMTVFEMYRLYYHLPDPQPESLLPAVPATPAQAAGESQPLVESPLQPALAPRAPSGPSGL